MKDIDIYRIVDKSGASFVHEEVCRSCAKQKMKEGFEVEFDGHLYRYTYVKDGISYYSDGSDDDDPEIFCTLCEGYLISEEDEPLPTQISDT